MRRIALAVVVLAGAVPAAALALGRAPADGSLSVEGGRGIVAVEARGGVIGRLDRGVVEVVDLTPEDGYDPLVRGAERQKPVNERKTVYAGDKINFRVIGGAFRVVVRGVGIDLSAVGRGVVLLDGDERFPDMGVYSLSGDDCRVAPATCTPVPATATRLALGERGRGGDKDKQQSSSASRAIMP